MIEPMLEERKTDWKRLTLEAAAIVGSILLAFAIDAWWGEVQERQFEKETMQGLLEEYQGHRKSLEIGKKLHLQILRAVASLITASHRGTYESEEFEVDEAISVLQIPPTTDLGSGVRDALVSSGQLELLSDKLLRYQLAEWESVMDELRDDEQTGMTTVLEIVAPYLTRHGVPNAYSSVFVTAAAADAPLHGAARSLASDDKAMKRLFSDPEFLSILEFRYRFLAHTTFEFDRVIAEIESILTALGGPVDD
jgi:hypothetical protein